MRISAPFHLPLTRIPCARSPPRRGKAGACHVDPRGQLTTFRHVHHLNRNKTKGWARTSFGVLRKALKTASSTSTFSTRLAGYSGSYSTVSRRRWGPPDHQRRLGVPPPRRTTVMHTSAPLHHTRPPKPPLRRESRYRHPPPRYCWRSQLSPQPIPPPRLHCWYSSFLLPGGACGAAGRCHHAATPSCGQLADAPTLSPPPVGWPRPRTLSAAARVCWSGKPGSFSRPVAPLFPSNRGRLSPCCVRVGPPPRYQQTTSLLD